MSTSYGICPAINLHWHNDSGDLANGYRLYAFDQQTGDPAPTYTSEEATADHTHPIIIQPDGKVPGEGLYLSSDFTYSFILKNELDAEVETINNVRINSAIYDSYIVGSTPLASDWLSLEVGGLPLTPVSGATYFVLSEGEYQGESYRYDSENDVYVLANMGSGVSEEDFLEHTNNTTDAHGINNKADKTYVDSQDTILQTAISNNTLQIIANGQNIAGLEADKRDKSDTGSNIATSDSDATSIADSIGVLQSDINTQDLTSVLSNGSNGTAPDGQNISFSTQAGRQVLFGYTGYVIFEGKSGQSVQFRAWNSGNTDFTSWFMSEGNFYPNKTGKYIGTTSYPLMNIYAEDVKNVQLLGGLSDGRLFDNTNPFKHSASIANTLKYASLGLDQYVDLTISAGTNDINSATYEISISSKFNNNDIEGSIVKTFGRDTSETRILGDEIENAYYIEELSRATNSIVVRVHSFTSLSNSVNIGCRILNANNAVATPFSFVLGSVTDETAITAREDNTYARVEDVPSQAIEAYGDFTSDLSGFKKYNITGKKHTCTFDDATRKMTISPTDTSYMIAQAGKSVEISTDFEAITADAEGMWYYYFEYDGTTVTLIASQSISEEIIVNKVFICYQYWNADDSRWELPSYADESHGFRMDGITHISEHETEGARLSKLGNKYAMSINAEGNGSDDEHAQILSLDSGTMWDEDLRHAYGGALVAPVNVDVYYLDGAEKLRRKVADDFPVISAGTGLRLAFNDFDGTNWSQTEVANGDYVLCHLFSDNFDGYGVHAVQGQAEYSNVGDAREGAITEVNNIISVLPLLEDKYLYTMILQTRNTYGNEVKARFIQVGTDEDFVDGRFENSVGGGSSSTANYNYFPYVPQVTAPLETEGTTYYYLPKHNLVTQKGDGTNIDHGRELWARSQNDTGVAIDDFKPVYAVGVGTETTNEVDVVVDKLALAIADSEAHLAGLGITTQDFADGAFGERTYHGDVNGIDTSAYSVGDWLYVSQTVAGAYTTTRPSGGYIARVGRVMVSDATNGVFRVDIDICGNVNSKTTKRPSGGTFSQWWCILDTDNIDLTGINNYGLDLSIAQTASGDQNNMGADFKIFNKLSTDSIDVNIFNVVRDDNTSDDGLGRYAYIYDNTTNRFRLFVYSISSVMDLSVTIKNIASGLALPIDVVNATAVIASTADELLLTRPSYGENLNLEMDGDCTNFDSANGTIRYRVHDGVLYLTGSNLSFVNSGSQFRFDVSDILDGTPITKKVCVARPNGDSYTNSVDLVNLQVSTTGISYISRAGYISNSTFDISLAMDISDILE